MMLHNRRNTLILTLILTLAGVLGMAKAFRAAASVVRPPLAMQVAATLPAATCPEVAPNERTCELWAKEGTLTMPGGEIVPIWGFANSAAVSPTLPGPTLVVNAGDAVNVVLHNEIMSETVSLSFSGQEMPPDLTGISTTLTTTYSFTATVPGTFKYEAGLTPNGTRQVAMGLYGGLIIRPSTAGQAYDDPATAYNDEALLIYSEIDPDFNNDPNGFNMTEYSPKYWFINGKAYSETEKILTSPGNTVLLRYINSGLQERSIGVLGMHQTWIATDGYANPYATDVVAHTLGAGETADVLLSIPSDVVENTNYPIYNTGLQQLHNNGATNGIGGILTFVEVTSGLTRPVSGPLASNIQVSPDPTAGNVDLTLNAQLDSSATSNLDVVTWEYFLNDLGEDGTGYVVTPTVPGVSITVTTMIPTSTLATLPAGDVSIYVHGKDSAGTWGPVNSAVLDLVVEGPVITALYLEDSPANGTQDVIIRGTADDTPTGVINVIAAEYFLDTEGEPGTGITMTLNTQAPVVSLESTLTADTVNGLTEGTHTIYVRAQDVLGNWGGLETVDLEVDKTGPDTIGLGLTPNPTNGTVGANTFSNGVRLLIEANDPSRIAEAEGFIDYNGTAGDGTGFPLIASDAMYDGVQERAYFDIPLTTIQQLSEGDVPIGYHAKDMAGNWGEVNTLTLTVDLNGPVVSNVQATPIAATPAVTLTADIADMMGGNPGTNIVAAEWFVNLDPGFGNGNVLNAADGAFNSATEAVVGTANISSWGNGSYNIYVRAKDEAGNWSEVASTTLTITNNPNAMLTDNFESGSFAAWTNVVGFMNFSTAAAMEGNFGVAAPLQSGKPAYLIDGAPSNNTNLGCYSASFDFRTMNLGTLTEDTDFFLGLNRQSAPIFGITLEENAQGPELYVWSWQNGQRLISEGIHIEHQTQYELKLKWDAGNGTVSLWVNGQLAATLDNLILGDQDLAQIWFGPSNVTVSNAGELQFDDFARQPCGAGAYTIYLPTVFGNQQ